MKKKIYYWSPCLNKVATVKATLNSAISLAKYSNDYDVKIINVFGEWHNYKKIFKITTSMYLICLLIIIIFYLKQDMQVAGFPI